MCGPRGARTAATGASPSPRPRSPRRPGGAHHEDARPRREGAADPRRPAADPPTPTRCQGGGAGPAAAPIIILHDWRHGQCRTCPYGDRETLLRCVCAQRCYLVMECRSAVLLDLVCWLVGVLFAPVFSVEVVAQVGFSTTRVRTGYTATGHGLAWICARARSAWPSKTKSVRGAGVKSSSSDAITHGAPRNTNEGPIAMAMRQRELTHLILSRIRRGSKMCL